MLAINIQDEEIENIFAKRFKSNKDEFVKFIKQSLTKANDSETTFTYAKKDPMLHISKFQSDINNEELSNPFEHIDDVVEYSKKLRQGSWK